MLGTAREWIMFFRGLSAWIILMLVAYLIDPVELMGVATTFFGTVVIVFIYLGIKISNEKF